MFKNVHQINAISRLSNKLTGFSNADLIADTLSTNGTLVPLCPLGSNVYRYDPYFERILRFKVVEIKFTEDECFYDIECYENGEMVTYLTFEEKALGARYHKSRSAAKKNTNIVSAEHAKLVKSKTKQYFKDSLKFVYKNETKEGYFIELDTENLISLRAGLKRIISVDNSDEMKIIIDQYKGDQ